MSSAIDIRTITQSEAADAIGRRIARGRGGSAPDQARTEIISIRTMMDLGLGQGGLTEDRDPEAEGLPSVSSDEMELPWYTRAF